MFIDIPEGDVALRSVMIVEDEALVAMMMESVLRDLGVQHVSIFPDRGGAWETASTGDVDCAILDLRVRDGTTTEVADILMLRGIPIVFSTGSLGEERSERHRHLPVIAKPFSDDVLRLAVLDAVASRRGGGGQYGPYHEPRVATSGATD